MTIIDPRTGDLDDPLLREQAAAWLRRGRREGPEHTRIAALCRAQACGRSASDCEANAPCGLPRCDCATKVFTRTELHRTHGLESVSYALGPALGKKANER